MSAQNLRSKLMGLQPWVAMQSSKELPDTRRAKRNTRRGLLAKRGTQAEVTPDAIHPFIEVVKGAKAILLLSDDLQRFAVQCGQAGAMEDLAYFLSKPGLLKREPQLLLMFQNQPGRGAQIPERHLRGVLLLFEYRFLGVSLGMFTTNDRSGRNTLITLPELRPLLARVASEFLLANGAHGVMMSFRGSTAAINPVKTFTASSSARCRAAFRWTSQAREFPEYLRLGSTLDDTLARIGQRTRSNMRYNRRRAVKNLGCEFVPAAQVTKAEFLAFNRVCMYPITAKLAAWRYDVHAELAAPLFMGIRDREGRWLSLLGARRFAPGSEILWQMNRKGLPQYSLGLVMRSFFLEHEIAQGVPRVYIEGGTSHPIYQSFQAEPLTDLVVLRRSLPARLAIFFSRHFVPMDNDLASMMIDPSLAWNREEVQPAAKGQRGLLVRQRTPASS